MAPIDLLMGATHMSGGGHGLALGTVHAGVLGAGEVGYLDDRREVGGQVRVL
ncbi:hypothetical protein GCM10020000_11600 [Streptomyces olivoverticillatus]